MSFRKGLFKALGSVSQRSSFTGHSLLRITPFTRKLSTGCVAGGDLLENSFDDLFDGIAKTPPTEPAAESQVPTETAASASTEAVLLPWEEPMTADPTRLTSRLHTSSVSAKDAAKVVTGLIQHATDASEIGDILERNKEHVNFISYNAAINRLGRLHKWKMAIATFNQGMRRADELQFTDDNKYVLYRSLFEVLVRKNLMTVASGIFQKFLDCGLKPDPKLLSFLLVGCSKPRNDSDDCRPFADHLFKLMLSVYEMKPTPYDYVSLMRAHANCRDLAKAYEIYKYVMNQEWSDSQTGGGDRNAIPAMTVAEYTTAAMLWLCSVRGANVDGLQLTAEIEALAVSRSLRLSTAAKNSILSTYLTYERSEDALVKFKSLFLDWDSESNAALRGLDADEREKLSGFDAISLSCTKSALLQIMQRPECRNDETAMRQLLEKVESIHRKQLSKFAEQMTGRIARAEANKLLSAQLAAHCSDWQKCLAFVHAHNEDFGMELFRQLRGDWFLDVHLYNPLEARVILRDAFSDENALERMKECFGKEETAVRIWTGAGSFGHSHGLSAMKRTVIDELQSWTPPLKAEPCDDCDTAVAIDPQHFELFLEKWQSGETDRDSFCPKQLSLDSTDDSSQ